MTPLFCIFAHPDDEAFGPGGSIATFATVRDVYIICVTNGQTKHEFQHIKHDNLSEIRREELLRSAEILGVKRVFFLEFEDGELRNNIYHEVSQAVGQILDEYQPDTLITFEQRGVSGHLDHVAVSMITTYVFGQVDALKKLLYYCEREEVIEKMRDDYFIHMPKGYKKEDVDLVVDISSVWDKKLRAMQQHSSQQKDIESTIAVTKDLPKEEYFLLVEK